MSFKIRFDMSSFLSSGTGKIVLGIGAVVIIFVALLVLRQGAPGSDLPDINIVTRHDVALQNSFTEAFLASSYAKDLGYTPEDTDKINYIQVSTFQAWIKALQSDTRIVDLAWGGGPTLFNQLAERGLMTPFDQSFLDVIDKSVPDQVAGVDMKGYLDNELIWVANAVSSFGFTVNNDKLAELNLTKPTTWEELASPDYFISTNIPSISMGNPTLTTSNTMIYQIIIQKFGWDKGWEILSRMAGNSEIYDGSISTRSAIISGEVAVGMTIDFYGVFAQADCKAKLTSCEYIIPTNGSIINGDPVALGTKGENPEGAFAFFKYINSPEGQANWIKNDRLPVDVNAFNTEIGKQRTDVKALYDETIANQGINFDGELAEDIEFTLQNYFDSVIAAPHPELVSAWGSAIDALDAGTIDQTAFDTKIAELFAPQLSQQDAIDNNNKLIDEPAYFLSQKSDWEAAALAKYNAFVPTGFLGPSSIDGSNSIQSFGEVYDDVNENLLEFTPIILVKNDV